MYPRIEDHSRNKVPGRYTQLRQNELLKIQKDGDVSSMQNIPEYLLTQMCFYTSMCDM